MTKKIDYPSVTEYGINILDSLNNYSLTNDGADYGDAGVNSNAMKFIAANTDILYNTTYFTDLEISDVTYNVWVNVTSFVTGAELPRKLLSIAITTITTVKARNIPRIDKTSFLTGKLGFLISAPPSPPIDIDLLLSL